MRSRALDREWFYHFRLRPFREVEWVALCVRSGIQRALVRERLHQIHVPGIETVRLDRAGNRGEYIQAPGDASTRAQPRAMPRAPQ